MVCLWFGCGYGYGMISRGWQGHSLSGERLSPVLLCRSGAAKD